MTSTSLLFPEVRNLTLRRFHGSKGLTFLLECEERAKKLKTLHFSHIVLILQGMGGSFCITIQYALVH